MNLHSAAAICLAALVGAALLAYTIHVVRKLRPAPNSASVLISRINAEKGSRRSGFDARLWPTHWPHDAPDRPFSTVEAHQVMQRHIDCTIRRCARKRAAWDTLVRAGHATPARSRS